jgi:hypothetical protein
LRPVADCQEILQTAVAALHQPSVASSDAIDSLSLREVKERECQGTHAPLVGHGVDIEDEDLSTKVGSSLRRRSVTNLDPCTSVTGVSAQRDIPIRRCGHIRAWWVNTNDKYTFPFQGQSVCLANEP